MAPDFERLARTPCPLASLASSGINPLSSALAFSCCRKAGRVWRKSPAKFRPGVGRTHIDDPNGFNAWPRRLDAEQTRRLPALNAPPELLLSSEQEVLVKRIGRDSDFEPFAAARDDRKHRGRGIRQPHVVLKLGHVFLGRPFLRERPRQHELGLEHGTGWADHPVKQLPPSTSPPGDSPAAERP